MAAQPGCTPPTDEPAPMADGEPSLITSQTLSPSPPPPRSGQGVTLGLGSQSNRPIAPAEIVLGSGRFLGQAGTSQVGQPIGQSGSDVTLDFANVDIRDVLKAVLGDLLKLSYTVDPAVQGAITLQTGKPIPRSSVIDVLSSALQLNGVALVARNGFYLAVPIANAARQAPLGGTAGFVTRIVPLQYAAAGELEKALETLVPSGTTLKADPARNLLLIAGPARDVSYVADNIATFDVDYLRGVSFALLPLRNGKAKDVAGDVTKLLIAAGRSMADIVRVVPIERMNAVLVTSMQPSYLARIQGWVERFDRGDGRSDQKLFIYRVQNGRAVELARVLRQALGIAGADGSRGSGQGAGATDLAPNSLTTTPPSANSFGSSANTAPAPLPPAVAAPGSPQLRSDPLASIGAAAVLGGDAGQATLPDIRVTADPTNNAIVVTATPQDYAPIEAALEKLDATPLQVLIEATVAEVTLTDSLSLGLQYYINSGNFRAIFAPGVSSVSPSRGANGPATPDSTFPGLGFLSGANFAYSAGGTNVVLQALSSLTKVRVLSSPNLLVLNNGTARLQVGDQVPVATQASTSNQAPGAPTVNSIDYRDTGIILNVSPRVNASGLVLLDVSEEVSQPSYSGTSPGAATTPTISQRRVTSSLAVNDGQTIGLAGLIKDNRLNGTSGLPWLKDLPVIGFLFGVRTESVTRTELIVLITPHVIRNREDGDAVTRELRQKLRLTVPIVARRR